MIGSESAQIKLNSSLDKWILQDKHSNVTALADASQLSYALGKHNWTISGDGNACSNGEQSYTIEMKLDVEKGSSHVMMANASAWRKGVIINQLPNCRDRSDEIGCKHPIPEYGYNKRVPPIALTSQDDEYVTPVPVMISLALLKVVAIEEEDHSIELQFQITLEWKENRATYHNLKTKSYLNALPLETINRLWLPLVVYTNTDQQETTRLGWFTEWSTNVLIKREGQFSRSRNLSLIHISEPTRPY